MRFAWEENDQQVDWLKEKERSKWITWVEREDDFKKSAGDLLIEAAKHYTYSNVINLRE